MNRYSCVVFLALALAGCERPKAPRSAAVPDNVSEDKPIILKEGQAVILVPEGKPSVKIGASVLKGKLVIAEIDPKGKSFFTVWSDEDTWETSVTDSTTAGQTTTVLDKDGDGIPDFRAVVKEGSAARFQMGEPEWIEVKAKE